MRISGQLVEAAHMKGTFVSRESGETVAYENVTVRVFDGREVVVLKASGDARDAALGLIGHEGAHVTLDFDSPREPVRTRTLGVAITDNGGASK